MILYGTTYDPCCAWVLGLGGTCPQCPPVPPPLCHIQVSFLARAFRYLSLFCCPSASYYGPFWSGWPSQPTSYLKLYQPFHTQKILSKNTEYQSISLLQNFIKKDKATSYCNAILPCHIAVIYCSAMLLECSWLPMPLWWLQFSA